MSDEELKIQTPCDLYEIRRFQDPKRGEVVEMMPVVENPDLAPMYFGEVQIQGGPRVRFRLSGVTMQEALADWEGALRKAIADLSERARQQKIQQHQEMFRKAILNPAGNGRM